MSTNGQLVFTDVDKITFKGVGNTSNAVVDTVTGKIGVGIDSPDANLHVLGNSYVSTNLELGGTLIMGTVNVSAHHSLEAVTAEGNTTPLTVEFQNTDTSLVASGNVEVGGELTVSGNATVAKELTVTGNVSDLNVVSNVNMLHTANTASIKLNSNVVTEFPRSKKLIRYPRVALTAASGESSGYEGYYVTESSNSADTNRHSWKAFNMTFGTDTSDNAWANDQVTTTYNGTNNAYNGSINLGTGAVNGEWIKLQLPHKIKLEYMKIWLKDNDGTRIPEDWILYGSNDNTNWTKLFSKTGQGAVHENTYNVNAKSMYNYLAVVVTKISGQTNYFRIVELEYFGTPEYDSEAYGTDVVVESVPNVPNTDWLEVYFDAKGLPNGAVTNPISGLGGTTINGTATNVTVSDGAFVFDGSSSYMTGGTTSISGNHHHSFSCWLKPTSANSGYRCIGYLFYSGSNNTTTGLFLNNNRPVFLTWGNNLISDHTLVQNEWVHVTAVYNGTGRTIYVNSEQIDSDTYSSYNINASATLLVGASTTTPGEVFGGSIANLRLFNRALTQDEIYQLYAYQKEYFGHGNLSMTLKAGRLGIGTSEPRAVLDVRGSLNFGIPNVHSDSLTGSGSIAASTEEAGYAPLGNDMYVVWGNHAIAHTGSGQYNWTWYFPNNFNMTVLSAVGTLRDCGYGYSFDRSGLGINGYYTNRISGHTKNDTIGSFTQHIHFVIIGKKV